MQNRHAFTLIELLAIIVILAIIAVITVPIILNVIENSKKGAIKDSAYGYKDAINKLYVSKLSEDTTYDLTGTFTPEELKINGLNISGQEPTDGWISIEKGTVLDYSLKFDEYVVNYDDTTNQPVVIKGGELKSQSPSVLEDRTYVSGEAIENYGGYNWHVIGDDGENVTLLMDYGENGNLKLPEDPNNNLSNGMMPHCLAEENSKCSFREAFSFSGTYLGSFYVLNSWRDSLIQVYLNNIFYNDIKSKIANEIVPSKICDDSGIYGGYLEIEIENSGTTCVLYNNYNARLITTSEYYNLSPMQPTLPSTIHQLNSRAIPKLSYVTKTTETSWLYSDFIGDWWIMSKAINGPDSDILPEQIVDKTGGTVQASGLNNNIILNGTFGGYSKIVRPVITVKK